MITLKSKEQIEIMAEGGQMLARILRELKAMVAVGVTTLDLDAKARELILAAGCKPSFLHYHPYGAKRPYPYTLCSSINNGVVHGLPSDKPLNPGDIVKLDLGLIHKGLHSDSAITVALEPVAAEVSKLIHVTQTALHKGIEQVKIGNTLGDVGFAIAKEIRKGGFYIVDSLTGHGIGESLHEDPPVYNNGSKGKGITIEEGLVIAIEPMVAIGTSHVKQLKDDSFVSADGSMVAHFEHTVAATKQGPRILTK